MISRKVSVVNEMASQKASTLSHSTSSMATAIVSEVSGAAIAAAQKASHVASGIKCKTYIAKDKAAEMASLLKGKANHS